MTTNKPPLVLVPNLTRAEKIQAEAEAELAALTRLKAARAKRRQAEYRLKHPRRKAWSPDSRERHLIKIGLAAGLTHQQLAAITGVSTATLHKRCPELLATGAHEVNAKVAAKLFQKCMKGDTIALLFWCKSRLGWNEKQLIEHTGKDGGPIVYEQIEAEAAAFTSRIEQMAVRFTPPKPANDEQSEPPPPAAKEGAQA